MPVSGERMVPPMIPAMPTAAQRPISPPGSHCPKSPPSAPPIMSKGASTPPEVPEPRETAQTRALATTSPSKAAPMISPRSRP